MVLYFLYYIQLLSYFTTNSTLDLAIFVILYRILKLLIHQFQFQLTANRELLNKKSEYQSKGYMGGEPQIIKE